MLPTGEKWILLGASRGLGFEFAKKTLAMKTCRDLVLISRKIENRDLISTTDTKIEKVPADFTNESDWESLVQKILNQNPDRIFYFAGGGPYGDYGSKAWKDHLWAYRLNFLFPAFLLQQALKQSGLRQMTFVGSAIAEDKVDPGAGSYSAAKHALKGLVTTVQEENRLKKSQLDLRLFSPGYMDTSLLPPDAWPRQQVGKVLPVNTVSDRLWSWILDQNDANTHLKF